MADRDDEMVLRVARMEAFSDGVFAIAITLLVLEIAIPPGFEGHLLRGVLSQWPSYLAYIVSFATIGAIWLGHNTITHYMHSANTLISQAESRTAAAGVIPAVSHQIALREPGIA
ncbi:MAG TPA: TMEM175 family protein [Propionibacteriaceae bacterium]